MQFSENSRVWIYQSDRELSAENCKAIQQQLDGFVKEWQAHGNDLCAKAEIRYRRFIILAVDEEKAPATGCSIDKSVALMKSLEQEFHINLFDRMQLAYRDGAELKTCAKDEFEQLIAQGAVTADTIVFNNLIPTYRELETNWEIPLKDSWHSRVFSC